VLDIRNLTVNFGGQGILNGIDFRLEAGGSLAIVGESGAGKTTVGRAIMGLCSGTVGGEVFFHGQDLLSLDKEAMRRIRWNRIAMVFQNINQVLNPVHRVIDQVAEPMVEHGFKDKREARERAEETLLEMGLSRDRLCLYPHQLSGGEQQRVLLAMATANQPELLILDEPLAGLDGSSRLKMIALLQGLNLGRGTALLVFTHDMETALRISDRMASLYAGRIMELGPSESVISLPRHPYTRALIRAYPDIVTPKDLQGIKGRLTRPVEGCPFHPRCTQAVEICSRQTPPLTNQRGRMLACHRKGIIPLMRTVGLTKRFRNLVAVESVDLTIYGGETLALVGPSGSGKSTLARMLVGLIRPTRGRIYLEDREAQPGKAFYRRVQMVFQNPGDSLSHRLTVLDLVKEPLVVQHAVSRAECHKRALEAIGEAQLPGDEEFLRRYPHSLSGGELQRVAIARALVLDPDLLIADEPTSALDPSVQAKILKLLLQLQEDRGLSLLFITHDIAVARKISDRIAVMYEGRIVEQGPAAGILQSPKHPCTEGLVASAPRLTEKRPRYGDIQETGLDALSASRSAATP